MVKTDKEHIQNSDQKQLYILIFALNEMLTTLESINYAISNPEKITEIHTFQVCRPHLGFSTCGFLRLGHSVWILVPNIGVAVGIALLSGLEAELRLVKTGPRSAVYVTF